MLIRACCVERKRIQEAQPGLRDDREARVVEQSPDESDGTGMERRIDSAREGQEFRQHFVSGLQMVRFQGLVAYTDTRIPLISGAAQRDPVEGIGKEAPHVGRFGVP